MVSAFSIDSILGTPKHVDYTKRIDQRTDYLHEHHLPLYYRRRHFCTRRSISPPSITPRITPHTLSDDEDDKVTRRPRTSITMYQRDFLENEFQKERYPTLAYIDKLSRQIRLPQYVIKVWFQNRRAKYRKEGHRRKQQQQQQQQQQQHENKVDIDYSYKLQFDDTNKTSTKSTYSSWLTTADSNKTRESSKHLNSNNNLLCSCYECQDRKRYVHY